MKKFIHIGMPKTMTSVLQKFFYPIHKDIYYLGIGNGENLIDYIDDDINILFETLIIYSNEDYYLKNKNYYLNIFNKHYNNAKILKKKVFGVSSEWISFNFSPDMSDSYLKVKRLSEFFDKDTIIICFIRNQDELLKSLYNEYVKVGFAFSYEEFINYIYNFKDRNFYYDLFYDIQFEKYLKYFKQENIYFLPIEKYRDENKNLINYNGRVKIIEDLCRILEIDYPNDIELGYVNPSLSSQELYHKLELNKKYKHDFGNSIFEHSNLHRYRKYLEKEKAVGIYDYFKDVKVKRFLLEEAKLLAKRSNKKIDYIYNINIYKKLIAEFNNSNLNLQKKFEIMLPKEYFYV